LTRAAVAEDSAAGWTDVGMGKQLLLIGAGDFANELALIAKRIDPKGAIWERISYVATSRTEVGKEQLFGRVDYCDDDILSGAVTADAAIALGASHLRMRVAERYAKVPALTFPNLIDPGNDHDLALIKMGIGNIIHRNVTMTFKVVMGDFNFFNKSSTIGHDTTFGSFNTVSPAATLLSNVRLGNCCMIGANACVLPKIRIADRTTVGACALLRHDVDEPGHIFLGIPAQKQS
jgi:acetyltransferase-like isoleucine patch superfamily enzyme